MIAPLMNKLQKNPTTGSQSDIIQSVISNKPLKMVSDEDALSAKTFGVGHQDGKKTRSLLNICGSKNSQFSLQIWCNFILDKHWSKLGSL